MFSWTRLSSNRLRFFLAVLVAGVLGTAASPDALGQMGNVPHEIAPLNAPFEMPHPVRPTFPDRTFDVRNYGATEAAAAGGMIDDAVHRAIEAAHAAGGGTVLIPAGQWLSGPIHLKSNINLHVAEGALVRFSTNRDDYLPVVRQRHEGVEALNYSPMIYAAGVRNVALTGRGTLDAQAQPWWDWYRQHGPPPRAMASKVPLSRRDFGKGSGMEGMRPNFVVFMDAENVLVEGITLNDSPMWNVHLIYVTNAIVRNVTVNSLDAPNGDGIVIDSSQNVLVEYNTLRTGDDAVVLKSGLNEEGLQINIPTENVVIRNFEAIDVRTGSGGVVFGSESSGGIRNIYVHDALFDGADRGIRFKTERGRGNVIENIFIRDIRMRNITYEAINVNTFYTGPRAQGPSPLIRNVHIRDVTIDTVPTGISFIGLPEKWLENFTLENITINNAERGARVTRVKNLTMRNVVINSNQRAMVFNNVLEIELDNVTLTDRQGGEPLVIEGGYTGAIFLNDFPRRLVAFGVGVSEEVLLTEPVQQAW
jgi:polygalacturonase